MQTTTWNQMTNQLRAQSPRRGYAIRKHLIEHPRDGGMHFSASLPTGQRASYLRRLDDGETLVVEEYRDRYTARLKSPVMKGIETSLKETPASSFLALLALGGIVGLALGRSGEAAIVGAIVGSVAGLTAVSLANAEEKPRTSRAAEGTLQLAAEAMLLAADGAPKP